MLVGMGQNMLVYTLRQAASARVHSLCHRTASRANMRAVRAHRLYDIVSHFYKSITRLGGRLPGICLEVEPSQSSQHVLPGRRTLHHAYKNA